MKILTIVGARPQFVKAAVFSRLVAQTEGVEEIIVHTGQHYDEKMSSVFFQEMSIPKPQYTLHTGGKSHGVMTGEMLIEIEPIVQKEKPDIVLVYGDTNSTLAGALVASKLHIPIAHVEAGLRSFNKKMPEEINRILTDHVSTWMFCPTEVSRTQLLKEGLSGDSVFVVGDIMYDAALFYKDHLKPTSEIHDLVGSMEKFSLCTVHRAENTDDEVKLRSIFSGLRKAAEKTPIVLPLHPRTRKRVESFDLDLTGLKIIEPVSYGDILFLLAQSQLVLTDSGGMQKEAYFFGKPCITLREETEWVETTRAGVNILVGSSEDRIYSAFEKAMGSHLEFPTSLYGDGKTGERILETLSQARSGNN